ncbi:MAG: GAF domain-containing sensor histidine kinase [Armatimonadota bacterium]|nr:GAF domain-containing sensor histidine kinase [Armatimonadota bacterium]MDR7451944.1 GAF domain-containing sensor histidine kinase [Armatimonadota bacterium]MDR7466626.1 GAF domain-containing sensor histidine kinase [Armatimonadota bacterium]MDR7492900.1 GAF domain-containing sensor histidine kinase [Armatimonadota bacterium]MDR7500427.1 GAF domain-containing sensor histidine kinase [Armatimonadota bacterium]
MRVRPGFTEAVIPLRWLVLASLIALEALRPSPGPRIALIGLYAAIFLYTLALTLYAWRYPEADDAVMRAGIGFDTVAIATGMVLTAHGREYLLLAFPVAALAGVLLGQSGAAVVSAAVGAVQLPAVPHSLFAPGNYVLWGLTVLACLCTGIASSAGAEDRMRRRRFGRLLEELRRIAGAVPNAAGAASAALVMLADHFRAHGGSLMLFDPPSGQLEILAAHHLPETYRRVRTALGEGVAGRILQDGQATLLTPETPIPPRPARDEIGSALCVPLAALGRPVGVLNLNRGRAAPRFTREDLQAAELAAQPVGAILLRAQQERVCAAALAEAAAGFGEVSRALARDPAVLWPALLDVARSLASARFAVLALEREDTGTVDLVGMRGIDGPTAAGLLPHLLAASTRGEIGVIPEGSAGSGAPGTVACIPLRAEGQTLGALGLGFAGDPVAPGLLQAVASHVAAAVHTARFAHRIADIGVLEERRRIAREIHDGLAQTVAEALLQTDLSAAAGPDQGRGDLRELRTVLERAMGELREFMTELRRSERTDESLFAALDAMGRDFGRRHRIPTTVVTRGQDGPLPSAVRHAVLAIARQALTNVRAHARATAVTITAEATEDAASVSIADNGVGFDLGAFRARPPGGRHLGITSMEERAALVGGILQVESRPGGGTKVTVRIPLGRGRDENPRPAG